MKEQVEKKVNYWSNGNIDTEYHLNQRGQKHGSYKLYYSNGNLLVQTEFKNGQTNGLFKDKSGDGSFNFITTPKKHEDFGLRIEFEK